MHCKRLSDGKTRGADNGAHSRRPAPAANRGKVLNLWPEGPCPKVLCRGLLDGRRASPRANDSLKANYLSARGACVNARLCDKPLPAREMEHEPKPGEYATPSEGGPGADNESWQSLTSWAEECMMALGGQGS